MFSVLDLFSGLGGISYGLHRAGGFKTVAFCEIEEFPRRVLNHYWPDVPVIEDVANVSRDALDALGVSRIDVITAGFPCQPFSHAGLKQGGDDERYLWPEIGRLIRALRPQYIILENVPNLLALNDGREFGIILGELAECGYDAEWEVIPASAFGAPHQRERVFVVAYSNEVNGQEGMGIESDGAAQIFTESPGRRDEFWRQAPDSVNRVDDGLPPGFYQDAVGAYGNSVVPVIFEWIGQQINRREASRIAT